MKLAAVLLVVAAALLILGGMLIESGRHAWGFLLFGLFGGVFNLCVLRFVSMFPPKRDPPT